MNIPIANFISLKKKKRKEKRSGHVMKCLLTELGRAGRENIWPSVMAHGPRCARSVRHDLGPNIFPSGPPTQSISTYSLASLSRRVYERSFLWTSVFIHVEIRTNYHNKNFALGLSLKERLRGIRKWSILVRQP